MGKNFDNIIEMSKFKEKVVGLDDIFLDPNNPRFSNKERLTPDSRIMEEGIQRSCLQKMQEFDIRELKDSIARVGFLPIDRIVVRAIPNADDKYVVVEGNRRITALKQLKEDYESGEIDLTKDIFESIIKLKVYLYEGKEPDIAWAIQGIRHISGIKNWRPYQQAKLLAKLVSERNIKIEDAGKIIGIGAIKSARLLRSYYAYEQCIDDDEFGDYLSVDHFSFFQEAIFQSLFTPLQTWLDWNEKEEVFKNEKNLKKYLSWITSTDENKPPRIGRAIDARDILGKAIEGYPLFLQKFEADNNFSIEQLGYEIWNEEKEPRELNDWLEILKDLNDTIENLPDIKIKRSKEHYQQIVNQLKELRSLVEAHIKTLESQ
jgi:hypothetical protein